MIAGGLWKNPLLIQVYADVMHLPLSVVGSVRRGVVMPDEDNASAYDVLFGEYTALHDHFGRGGNDVMHRLRRVRREAVRRRHERVTTA